MGLIQTSKWSPTFFITERGKPGHQCKHFADFKGGSEVCWQRHFMFSFSVKLKMRSSVEFVFVGR